MGTPRVLRGESRARVPHNSGRLCSAGLCPALWGLLALIPESSVDLIFADPPYFLSNGGITCHPGKMVSVNKGAWDKSQGPALGPARARIENIHEFNRAWLAGA